MAKLLLISLLLISGCCMTAEEMTQAINECEQHELGIEWWRNGFTWCINSYQCKPNNVK